MRIEQLELLVEISKNRSLSAASRQVHMTVQALSMSIKAMEEELGIKLLNRTYQGVSMTENGEKLVDLYRNFSMGLDKLKQFDSAHKRANISGELQVSVNYFGLVGFLPHLVCDLEYEAPNIKISVVEMSQKQIIEQVLQKKIEFGLICVCCVDEHKIYSVHEKLEFFPLLESKMVCQMQAGYPIAGYKSISLKNALNYPGIIYQPDIDSKFSIVNVLNEFGNTQNIMLTNSNAIYREMILSGKKIGFNFNMVGNVVTGKSANEIIDVPVKENAVALFGYVSNKGQILSETTAYFLDYLKKYATITIK